MRYRLLKFLACPACLHRTLRVRDVVERQELEVVPGAFSDAGECPCNASKFYPQRAADQVCVCWNVSITAGELVCEACNAVYPIRNGVPRMTGVVDASEEKLRVIKEMTSSSFGFEWNHYSDLGWMEGPQKSSTTSKPSKEIERQSFLTKALPLRPEFEGKLILDAGCGNGRYSYQARALGAEVIGVDLSDAVDAAARNLRAYPDVHVVQGDIFNLPLANGLFDRVFSIGVLMHTGDARRAFASLVTHLQPGGVIAITVYRKGNAIYEYVDRVLRKRTVAMEYGELMKLSARLARIARLAWNTRKITFGKPILYSLINCFVRLESKTHNVFDWYSAPVASHHTYDEVYSWFAENNIEVVADRNRKKNLFVKLLRSPAGGVTVKGAKRSSAGAHSAARRVEQIA